MLFARWVSGLFQIADQLGTIFFVGHTRVEHFRSPYKTSRAFKELVQGGLIPDDAVFNHGPGYSHRASESRPNGVPEAAFAIELGWFV